MTNYDAFFSRAAKANQGSAIRKMGVMTARMPDMISFAPGYPDPALFAYEEFREIAAQVLSGSDPGALQYGPTRGYAPLLEVLSGILRSRGIEATESQVMVTTGSQQGLDLVARSLLDPGDVALVELPSYSGAIAAFRNTLATLVGVRQQADGIDLDDLDAVLLRERGAGRRVRFLYVVPNFQNPTGLVLSLDKRRRLLEWASRRDMLIVEDDPYGALYFDDSSSEADTRPLKADDVEGRVIYLSSFSKTLAPGLRVAWVTAPDPILAKLDAFKQSSDLLTPGLDQRLVNEAVRRGILDARLPNLRRVYQHKRTVMREALRQQLGELASWPEPKGGFFLWVTMPPHVNAEKMLERAIEKKVIYVVGGAFFVNGAGSNMMRLSFSLPSEARIVEGVTRLAGVIAHEVARQPVAAD